MGIKFLCDTCGKKLNIKEELAGKKGRCPKCDAVIKIPKQSMVTATESQEPANQVEQQKTKSVAAAKTASAAQVKAKPQSAKAAKGESAIDEGSPPPMPEGDLKAKAPKIPKPEIPAIDVTDRDVSDHDVSDHEDNSDPLIAPPDAKSETPVDVLAANPNAKWFIRPSSGGQFGPAESEVMKTWLGEGRVGRDSLVWCEGWEEWQSAAELFADELGGSPKQEEKKEEKTPDTTSSNSTLNRTFSHQQARQRARMMGIVLVVGLALLSIALAVVLFIVVNNASKKNDSGKDNDESENSSALLYFPPTGNHNQVLNPGDLDLI